MRSSPYHATALNSLLLLPSIVTAYNLDCSDLRDDGKEFNLKSLDGPRSVWTIERHPPTYTNTTFTIDICKPLRKPEGVAKDDYCPNGSRVCALERLYHPGEANENPPVEKAVPIAGEFSHSIGGNLDPHVKRLKTSKSTSEREKEGIRLELNGGKYQQQKEKAIIEFLCLKDDKKTEKRDDEEEEGGDEDSHDADGKVQDDGEGGKLTWISWDVEEDDTQVLRLQWDTKYACEDAASNARGSGGGHWGFFTWLIIILFMGVAAYLIFGSWLNYNRHSARGWDVVPHSDTIQDLPYLFRDWMRRVINTFQGGGSRGGYSAV